MSSQSSTFASGGSPSAAQVNGWAQGLLGLTSATANSGVVGTTFGAATTLITAPAVTVVASRRIKITVECSVQSTVAGDTAVLQIMEGGTQLQQRQYLCTPVNQAMGAPLSVIITPSAGSHTYSVNCWRNIGSGNVIMFAGSNVPAYILVEDIGAV